LTTDHAPPGPAGPRTGDPALALPPGLAGAPGIPARPVRVTEPMAVLWQGVEYPVAAWDVQGFRLANAIPRILTPGRGRVFELTLLIGGRGTRIEMQVQARALGQADTAGAPPDDPAAPPVAFRFVDLDRAQAEVLHRIVDHSINRQAVSLTRLLNETEEVRTARQATGARTVAIRRWVQVAAASAALALAGGAMWSRFTTVTARYAAVTAPAAGIPAPMPGTVAALAVAVGQTVRPGQVLAHVRPAGHERQLQALTDERQLLEAERDELLARHGATLTAAELAGSGQTVERARLEEALLLAERRLTVARQQLQAMRANGLPTARRQAERAAQEAEVVAARQAVLAAASRLDALQQSESLAGIGLAPGLMRDLSATPDALQARIDRIETRIAVAREREAQYARGEPVLASCDCTVTRIERRPGEWTDPSLPLVVLTESAAATLHALVPAEAARGLRAGDSARIELADGTRLGGRVVRMNYAAHWPGYSGLNDNVFAADRFARVEIRPERPLAAPVGMTAGIVISTDRWLSGLRAMVSL